MSKHVIVITADVILDSDTGSVKESVGSLMLDATTFKEGRLTQQDVDAFFTHVLAAYPNIGNDNKVTVALTATFEEKE